MNTVKRYLGVLWILIGIAAIIAVVAGAIHNIGAHGESDISRPVPWLIIIAVFTPIAVGLIIFGTYALKGEYDGEIEA